MSKIKIETLTTLHIGSGTVYQKDHDFVCGRSIEGNDEIAIVDLRKVLKLVGEENINAWMTAIENKRPLIDIVHQFSPSAKMEDFAERMIMRWSKPTDTLKEFIHDGQGRPYIPGSSLKGAIRTAVLSQIIDQVPNKEDKILDKNKDNVIKGVSAKKVEKYAFGQDPNKDVFRFLQVSDAVFHQGDEAAIKLVSLNERNNSSYWDKSKPQMVEVLMDQVDTVFDLKICHDQYAAARNSVHSMPLCMKDIPSLFAAVNAHTLSLLDDEINYWTERLDDENAENVDTYLENIKSIREQAEKCNHRLGSCVLRVGHGSGWRFITGAWGERLGNFKDEIIKRARPNNNKYTEYDFPKTRRVDIGCELLGFVRLSLM